MNKLKYFSLFEEKTEDRGSDGEDFSGIQNNILASPTENAFAIFAQDVESNEPIIDSIPGYNFIMVSTKKGMWALEGRECHLVGIGSPFGRTEYLEYLDTLPPHPLEMLRERMDHYELGESKYALLFGINGTVRILKAQNEGMFYIAYPGEKVDYELFTCLNDFTLPKNVRNMAEGALGKKMTSWLGKKFEHFIRDIIAPNEKTL